MPTIYKPKKKVKLYLPYKHDDRGAKYYNTPQWKNLRNSYIREHPLCEVCLMLGKLQGEMNVKDAQEIHHVVPFLSKVDEEERWDTLLDRDNLIALCTKHHKDIHAHRIDLTLLEEELWATEHMDRRDLFGRDNGDETPSFG